MVIPGIETFSLVKRALKRRALRQSGMDTPPTSPLDPITDEVAEAVGTVVDSLGYAATQEAKRSADFFSSNAQIAGDNLKTKLGRLFRRR